MENILPYLDRDTASVLRPKLQLARAKPGQRIVRETSPAPGLFVIRSGEVDILRSAGENEILVTTLGDGDLFGESSFLDGLPATASARARTECDLVVLTPEKVRPLFEDSPELFSQFYRALALHLSRKLRSATGDISSHDAPADRFGDLPSWEII